MRLNDLRTSFKIRAREGAMFVGQNCNIWTSVVQHEESSNAAAEPLGKRLCFCKFFTRDNLVILQFCKILCRIDHLELIIRGKSGTHTSFKFSCLKSNIFAGESCNQAREIEIEFRFEPQKIEIPQLVQSRCLIDLRD